MEQPESNEAEKRASGSLERMVSQPTRIEQPSSIKGRRWFFARGYAGGFGAEYGVTLDRRTVEVRCKNKAGAGKLVNIKGAWHWLANIQDNHNGQNQRRGEIGTFANSKSNRPEAQMRNKRSVWSVTNAGYSEAHFATFPPDLIKPCILAGSRAGDIVLDPFGGSGTTGMVANELGRKAILCELNPEYVKLIEQRTNVTPGFVL